MGSGASTGQSSAGGGGSAVGLPLEVADMDAPQVTIDDICAWLEAQPAPSAADKALTNEISERIRISGMSAPQVLLAMDRDELFEALEMTSALQHGASADDSARKHALHLVRAGREALRRDFCVSLKELPDAMDKVVYIMERFPLVLDCAGGQATRFLKYQRGSVLMVGSPRDMEPESLRRHLVAALRHGTLLVLDLDRLAGVELEQFFARDSFPREVLDRRALFSPAVFGPLLRPTLGDPDPADFLPSDQFKLVVACQAPAPPPKTALAMCVLRVQLANERASGTAEGEDGGGALAKALGVAKEVRRNSAELVEAAFDGDAEAVQRWLDKGYDLESADGHGHTALSEAASQGHAELVRRLLELGADPNRVSDERRSPLYRAAYNGHDETVELLLTSGGDPRLASKQGDAPFDVAKTPALQARLAAWDVAETDRLLEQRRRAIEAKWQERIASHVEREQLALREVHAELLELARRGDAPALARAFEQLADDALAANERPRATCDVRDERGSTLLAVAAQHDHAELVRFLLTEWRTLAAVEPQARDPLAPRRALLAKMLRPNVNARDCRGWTPVAIAVFHEAKRSLRLLLEHGGDPKLRNQYNKSAFDLAKDDLDAALNVVKSRAEIRQVLVDWENERRAVVATEDGASEEAAAAARAASGGKSAGKSGGKSTGKVSKAGAKKPSGKDAKPAGATAATPTNASAANASSSSSSTKAKKKK